MAQASRKKPKKRLLILLLLVAAAVLAFAIKSILFRESSPMEEARLLSDTGSAGVYPAEDGFVLINGTQLSRRDASAKELFSLDMPMANMAASASSKLTAAWSDTRLVVMNASGAVLQHQELASPILMMRCGADCYAVAVREDGQRVVYIYKAVDGSLVERLLIPYQSVLDMGFTSGNLSQFWLLTLDSHYTVPSAQVKTLQPGKALTANISITGQVVYAVSPGEKDLYTVGTHAIQKWDTAGSQTWERSIYGWTLVDMRRDKETGVQFLLGPASNQEEEVPLTELWYIASNGKEQRFSLPAGCTQAVLGETQIMAFSQAGIYTVALKTGDTQFYNAELPMKHVTGLPQCGAAILEGADGSASWLPLR